MRAHNVGLRWVEAEELRLAAAAAAFTLTALPSPGGPAVECEGVGASYGRMRALRDVDLVLERGQLAFLVGPSGSGKTTLLKLIHGQVRPTTGRLIVAGMDVRRRRRGSVRRLRQSVGVVFQDYKLLERLTAAENVAYALRVADLGLAPGEAIRRSAAALRQVGLGGREAAYPRQLSGGQQQRLAIARALAARPSILLADEPTASLDDANAENVMALLHRIGRGGTTVLVATHDSNMVAMSGCRVLTLRQGEVVQDRQPRAAAVPETMLWAVQ